MPLLEITTGRPFEVAVPDDWRERVVPAADGFELRGDDTGRSVLYLSASKDRLLASLSLSELLDELSHRGTRPAISREALSFFLHDGQVPYPRTLHEGVHALAIGDRCRVSTAGGTVRLSFSLEFPYLSGLSREDQAPDPERLLGLLASATADALASETGAILLLSAGKDSTGLALALAEAGRTDVACVTYAGEGDDEHVFASGVCRKLGLEHRVFSLDTLGDAVPDMLRRFFTESPAPAGDLAQIPTVLAAASESGPGRAIVEGTGNDATFGYVPRRKDRTAARLAVGRWGPADHLKALVPPGSRLNHLLKDPVELNWSGLRVRHVDTRRLFEGAVNTSRHWREVRRGLKGVDTIDARGLLRGRHFEMGSQKEKIVLAAEAVGARSVHPYQDPRVTDYYFNLPRSSRYDADRLVNKMLLRELLSRRLGYDERLIGKRGFVFDGAAFVRRYSEMVREEIVECSLFYRAEAEKLARGVDHVDRGPFVWHHLIGLYQFAAWHNHSRFVR